METQPIEPRVSIAIMSHPKRAKEAQALARRLDGARVITDPHPDVNPSALKTAIHAWGAVAPGATHHLVVQDDVELSDEFIDRVHSGIRLFPDAVLAFYSNWSSQNAAAIRLSAAAGATWVRETGVEYFPTLALVLPSGYIGEYLDLARFYSTSFWHEDDDLMRQFILDRGIDAYLSVPCLVEHGNLESIAGNMWHGERRAPCFTVTPAHEPSYEALAHSLEYCPWMTYNRTLLMARAVYRDRPIWIKRPWTDMAAPFALDPAALRGSCDKLVSRSPRLQKAQDELGELVVFSLWLTSFLMGTLLRAGKVPVRVLSGDPVQGGDPLRRAGLHTIAAGAAGWTALPVSLLATYSAETTELAEEGFTSGLSGC